MTEPTVRKGPHLDDIAKPCRQLSAETHGDQNATDGLRKTDPSVALASTAALKTCRVTLSPTRCVLRSHKKEDLSGRAHVYGAA